MIVSTGQHLGYCTNVHAYDSVEGMVAALEEHAAPLRERLAVDGPLGVGLWFPEGVAGELARSPKPLRAALERLGLYVFTVNAFPFGTFHGRRVKDAVFRPSWRERERLDYTLRAAEALAALLPEGIDGSISTHTGAHKSWGATENDAAEIAAGFVAAAEGLAALERRTGRCIRLALEPEPHSFVETTDEAVEFFTTHLHPASAAARRHLGLCYDACHQSVELEDMAASVRALRDAEIAIAKVQVSCAIVVPEPARDRERLRPFAEDTWLHQVVLREEDGGRRIVGDLPDALADAGAARATEWRVHYHVPVFADRLDDEGRLRTTRPDLERLLSEVADVAVTEHLEIETYSYGAIPAERRRALGTETLLDCLHREFIWTLDHLPPTR